jgi:hypothetical protein
VMSKSYQSFAFSPNLLSADDVAAICAVYPPGPELNCAAPPDSGYDACQIPVGERPPCKLASVTQDSASCGCRLAAPPRGPLPTLTALGLGLAALAKRRLRARRRVAN